MSYVSGRRSHPHQRREAKRARRRKRLERGGGFTRAMKRAGDARLGRQNLEALLFGNGKMRHRVSRGHRA